MAKEIFGTIQTVTGFSIPLERGEYALYPHGRHLRGAVGYMALELGLEIAERFPDLKWDGVIFRDLLPLSRCDKPYKINPDGTFDNCSECNDFYDSRMLKSVRTQNVEYKEIKEGRKYRLSIVVQDETYLKDMNVIMQFISEHGVSFGKRTTAGNGKFILRDMHVQDIMPAINGKGMLVSGAVIPSGTVPVMLSQTLRSTGEFKIERLKVAPKGRVLEDVSGFYVGDYGGLGFGEFVCSV